MDVIQLAEAIVERFGNIDSEVKQGDDLYLYMTELLTMCLIWHSFHDAVGEGDGDRVINMWKFSSSFFKIAIERTTAFILLMQYHFLLPEQLAEQLKWSRFINTSGQQGCNIPCDLHLEHLNRQLKGSLRNLRSNMDSNAIHRAGKALVVVHSVTLHFSRELNLKEDSGQHHRPAFKKDLQKLVTILGEIDPFKFCDKRKFTS